MRLYRYATNRNCWFRSRKSSLSKLAHLKTRVNMSATKHQTKYCKQNVFAILYIIKAPKLTEPLTISTHVNHSTMSSARNVGHIHNALFNVLLMFIHFPGRRHRRAVEPCWRSLRPHHGKHQHFVQGPHYDVTTGVPVDGFFT